MTSLLFGVKPTDAATFISVAVALIAAAVARVLCARATRNENRSADSAKVRVTL
jgi:hypothetical protein